MNEEIINLIKGRGYWRINFRPSVLPTPELALTRCQEVVSRATVRLRGWDYPHMSTKTDDVGGLDRLANCIQSWTSWSWHLEFWRMYVSEQFLHYLSFHEDWKLENCNVLTEQVEKPGESRLGVIQSTWLVVEVFEFLSRLTQQGLYANGATISIRLNNTLGRELHIDDQERFPFAVPKVTQAEQIEFVKTVSPDDTQQPRILASEALYYIYDRFGWQPNASQMKADIERLYNVRMGS